MTTNDIRVIVRQHLLTDRMFGLDFIPLRLPPTQRTLSPARPSRPPTSAETAPRPRETVPSARPAIAPSTTRDLHPASTGDVRTFRTMAVGERLDTAAKLQRLRLLDDSQVKGCRKCSLCETRTQTVFGIGDPDARIVFVGEAPGFEEDQKGLPFVGRAGELLTRMIAAMGLTREKVYICNVLKCRPPGNRTPTADEMLTCSPYLREQIEVIRPDVLVALGAPASKTLLNTAETISRLRGRFHRYFFSGETDVGPSIPLMPTFHPAYLLRSPDEKRKTWDDLKMVMEFLRLPISKGGRE